MIRAALKLAVIFILVTAGVRFGYSQLEQRLLGDVCKPLRGKAAERQAQARPAPEPPAAGQDFQIIVRRNIFQTAAASAGKPLEETATPAPLPTKLNLALIGTVTGLEQGSWAVISDNVKKKQQVVRTDGEIQGTGAVVKAIAWNRVTLEVNGRTEVLEMPKPKPGRPGAQVSRNMNRIELPQPEIIEEDPAAEQPAPPPVLRPHRRINLPPAPEEGVEIIEEEPPPPDASDEVPELPELDNEEPPSAELPPAE